MCGAYLGSPFPDQHLAYLLAPVTGSVEIPFPYTAIAATAAASAWLLRRVAKQQFSLGQLCTEVDNPLSGLISVGR